MGIRTELAGVQRALGSTSIAKIAPALLPRIRGASTTCRRVAFAWYAPGCLEFVALRLGVRDDVAVPEGDDTVAPVGDLGGVGHHDDGTPLCA